MAEDSDAAFRQENAKRNELVEIASGLMGLYADWARRDQAVIFVQALEDWLDARDRAIAARDAGEGD